MAVIRALLRSRRLGLEQNKLQRLRRDVEGHELDWQALNIESPDNQEPGWYITDYPHPFKTPGESGSHIEVLGLNQTGPQILGFRPLSNPYPRGAEIRCANSAVDWIRFNEKETDQPNEAARILHFRSRLAYLTGDPITPSGQGWDTEIRKTAAQLQKALQESAEYIFLGEMKLVGDWKDARALAWSTTCHLSKPSSDLPGHPIHFLMYRDNGRWKISKYQLEAALGLWWWSLKQLQPQPGDERSFFGSKIMHTTESKMMDFKSAIRLWVTQTDPITERIPPTDSTSSNCAGPSQTSASHRSEAYHLTSFSVSTTPLPLPLPRDPTAGRITTESDSRVLLTIETRSSPLQMIAQDIFTVFMCRIADILEPLKEAAPRQTQTAALNLLGNSSNRPYLGLMNSHVQSIADKLVAAGIGSQEDVLMSIIPPLLQSSKLPHLDNVMEELLSRSRSFRRDGKFQVVEDLLKGLFHLGPPQFQERVVRALGDVYRAAVRSQNKSEQDFGQRGFKEMREICAKSQLSEQAEQTLSHYEAVGEYFKKRGAGSQPGDHPRVLSEKLLEELISQPARPRGLILIDEIHLSEGKPDYLPRILEWALRKNCPELIEDLWSVDTKLIHETGSQVRTPIFWAIDFGCDAETFQRLLEWPTMRPDSTVNGMTPLMLAAERGYHEGVDLLLKQGADTRAKDKEGRTPLLLAAINGDKKTVEWLLQSGVDVNTPLQTGDYGSALAAAAAIGHTAIVKFLVRDGKANVDMPLQTGDYGSTLAAAAAMGHIEIVKFLVQDGKANVDMSFQTGDYGSALAAAAAMGRTEIVKFLVQDGKADVNMVLQTGNYGSALVAAAAAKWNTKTIKFLVQDGKADVNMSLQTGDYSNALAAAVYWGRVETVKFLVQDGKADVNTALQTRAYSSALEITTAEGSIEIVKFIVQDGNTDVLTLGHEYGVRLFSKGDKDEEAASVLLAVWELRRAQGESHREAAMQTALCIVGLSVKTEHLARLEVLYRWITQNPTENQTESDCIWARYQLGAVQAVQGKYVIAEASLRRALDRQTELFGAENPDRLQFTQVLAEVVRRDRRSLEAVTLVEGIWEGRGKWEVGQRSNGGVIQALMRIGHIYGDILCQSDDPRDLERAEAVLKEVWETTNDNLLEPEAVLRLAVLASSGDCYALSLMKRQRFGQAKMILGSVLQWKQRGGLRIDPSEVERTKHLLNKANDLDIMASKKKVRYQPSTVHFHPLKLQFLLDRWWWKPTAVVGHLTNSS